MFSLKGPLFSKEHDNSGAGGSFSSDQRLKLISDCSLDNSSIRDILLPCLRSPDAAVNGAALVKLHGPLHIVGITAEQSNLFGRELTDCKLQNPVLQDSGMLSFIIARSKSTEAAELLVEILNHQIDPRNNEDPSMTIAALINLGEKAEGALARLEYCLRFPSITYLAEDALERINLAVRTRNTADKIGTAYEQHPILKNCTALPEIQDRQQQGKWVDSYLHFSLSPQGNNSCCRVRIFTCPKEETIVVFSADSNSYGTSVTYGIEFLASYAASAFKLDPGRTTFIEHYSPSFGHSHEDKVSLISSLTNKGDKKIDLRNPLWTALDSEDSGFGWKALRSLGFKEEWL